MPQPHQRDREEPVKFWHSDKTLAHTLPITTPNPSEIASMTAVYATEHGFTMQKPQPGATPAAYAFVTYSAARNRPDPNRPLHDLIADQLKRYQPERKT